MALKKDLAHREVESIKIKGKPGEPDREVFARASLSPLIKAAATIDEYSIAKADYELSDLIVVLDNQVSKTLDDSGLGEAQRMLVGQAYTLDAIFNYMASVAANNLDRCHSTVELSMRIALRAQAQSRVTWLAVNDIRNPRLANFVNQANISGGHQQVNNYSEKPPNELLEVSDERVDTRAPRAAVKAHSTVETVGAVNRPKKRGRKKQGVS